MRRHTRSRMARRAVPPLLVAALLTTPAQVHAAWEHAVAAYREGNFEAAVAELRGVLDTHPDYAPGHRLLGQALSRLERYPEAVDAFEGALQLENPPEISTLLGLAQAQLGAGRGAEALTTLDRVDPTTLPESLLEPWTVLLGRASGEAGPQEVLQRLEAAARAVPGNGFLQLLLGRAYDGVGRASEAAAAFERALVLDPGSSVAAEALVQTAFQAARETGDTAQRAEWYRRGAEAAEKLVAGDDTAEHWMLLGEARLGSKELEAAISAFEKAASRSPENPLPDYYLGTTRLSLGEERDAIASLEAGLRKGPDAELEKRFWLALGESLHQAHEYTRAADAYRRAGEARRAGLMESYAALDDANRDIDQARRDCRAQLAKMEALMEESRDLAGTPEYERLRRDVERLRRQCE